jgi:hypothetical protein
MAKKKLDHGDSDNYILLTIKRELTEINRRLTKMAKTLADLDAAITALGQAIDADVAQDAVVVDLVTKLIAALDNVTLPPDVQAQVDALEASVGKLSGDNAAVQAKLDEAQGKLPPSQP